MLDELLLSRLIAVASLATLTFALALVAAGAVLRFRGRRPGRFWATAVSLTVGLHVGTLILLSETNPLERVIALTVIGVVTIALLWRGRRAQAGLFLAGSALPWTMLWAFYAVLLLTAEADFEPYGTWTAFAFGLVPALVGLGLAVVGDPPPPERPVAAGGPSGARRVGLVAEVVTAPESVGPFPVSELGAFVTTVAAVALVGAVGLPRVVEPVVQVIAGGLLGNEARFLARPVRARRAHEAFSWLAHWEIDRMRTQTGRGLTVTKRGARAFLRDVPDRPDTRWIRVEWLAFLGELDEARRTAKAMPEDSPYARFERASALEFVDWLAGGTGDLAPVRAAADELDAADEDTRLRAEVAIAISEARRLAAAHGPEAGVAPLLAVRDRLGTRADGQLRRALWRTYLPVSFLIALFVTVLAAPVGWVFQL